MKSMTGYASSSLSFNALEITLELSSLNKKNFEASTYMPKEWQALEIDIINLIRDKIQRGKITFTLRTTTNNSSSALSWDDTQLQSIIQKLQTTSQSLNTPFTLDTNLLFSIVKTLTSNTTLPPLSDDLKDAILSQVPTLLDTLVHMRSNEGDFLKKDVLDRLKLLSNETQKIQTLAQNAPQDLQQNLLDRLSKINPDLNFDLSDERILKELAIYADKCDICEEITRLNSHIQVFNQYTESSEPIGRKMDFLCQEINREINTIASKSNNLHITHSTLLLKNELERIREQIQNIE